MFALKSLKELLFLFTHLVVLCKDITFPLIVNKTSSTKPVLGKQRMFFVHVLILF